MSFRADSALHIPRRRYVLVAGFLLVGISLIGLLSTNLRILRPHTVQLEGEEGLRLVGQYPSQKQDEFASEKYLKGAPTDNFRGLPSIALWLAVTYRAVLLLPQIICYPMSSISRRGYLLDGVCPCCILQTSVDSPLAS